ncbi:MAG: hypothetical protein ACOVP8_07825 [Phycisphaerales bacterium]
MCHYIHIAVPIAHAAWFEAEKWHGTSHARVEIVRGHPLAMHAKAWAFHCVPRQSCACGLFTRGLTANRGPTAEERHEKYLAKGWSRAKAQRAVEQAFGVSRSNTMVTHHQPISQFREPIAKMIIDIVTRIGTCAVLVEWPDRGKPGGTTYPGKGDHACTLAQFSTLDVLEGRLYFVSRD